LLPHTTPLPSTNPGNRWTQTQFPLYSFSTLSGIYPYHTTNNPKSLPFNLLELGLLNDIKNKQYLALYENLSGNPNPSKIYLIYGCYHLPNFYFYAFHPQKDVSNIPIHARILAWAVTEKLI
jgi:hypothetical protein